MRITEITEKLREHGYISNTDISCAVAGSMEGMPLLIEGAPGVGKSSLAAATAKMLGLPLIRVQFYEGLTYDKILYDYDYQKQLLTIESIKSVLDEKLHGKSIQEATELAGAMNFYGRDFLIERPVLKAISGGERCVLLLDEIDKASEEIEYTLLEVLENFSMSIPQYGTVTCPKDMRPVVFLTSNNYRELSDALKRRCNYLYIDKKSKEEIKEIMLLQSSLNPDLAEVIARCMEKVQALPLRQQPSVSEATRWAQYIQDHREELAATDHGIESTYCMIVKNQSDRSLVRNTLQVDMEKLV